MTSRDGENEVFEWSAHPAREQSGRALAGLALIAILAALAASLMQSATWGVAAAVFLLVALNRFYLPSRFSIDDDGISAAYPLRRQRLRWQDLTGFAHDRRGGLLSTTIGARQRRWRDALVSRGSRSAMHVLFGREPDEAIARIQSRLHGQNGLASRDSGIAAGEPSWAR